MDQIRRGRATASPAPRRWKRKRPPLGAAPSRSR